MWGVPACARCTSIVLGVAAGGSLAAAWQPPAWIVLACVPAGLDAAAEKVLALGHRPRLLVAANAVAGAALGAVLVTLALRHGALVVVALLAVPRAVPVLLARWRPRRRPARPSIPAARAAATSACGAAA